MNGRMARRLRKAAEFFPKGKRTYATQSNGRTVCVGAERAMYQAMKCARVRAAR